MNRREMLKLAGAGAVGTLVPAGPNADAGPGAPTPLVRDGLSFWLQTSLSRVLQMFASFEAMPSKLTPGVKPFAHGEVTFGDTLLAEEGARRH